MVFFSTTANGTRQNHRNQVKRNSGGGGGGGQIATPIFLPSVRKWEQKQVQIKTLEGEFSVTMWSPGMWKGSRCLVLSII